MNLNPRIALLSGLLFAFAAWGYILPGTSILRRLVEERDSLETSNVRVEGTLSLFNSARRDAARALRLTSDGSEASSEAAMMLKMPGRCRFEAWTPDGSRVAAVFSRGRARAEGTELAALSAAIQQICAILGARSGSESEGRAALERHLESLKIEWRRPSLGRLAGQVTYVMGALEGQPSFWVYKDTFLPARLQWTDAQQNKWDLHLVDYTSPVTGEMFPRVIELFRNGELALRFNAVRVSQTLLADKLF